MRRVVLLGASNVTRSLSTVVETACRLWGRPLDVLAASGHGRSYGCRMALLWRELPGIVECGLWPALADRPAAPTAALLTDVGNDILYGFSPDEIAGWVAECLDRLEAAGARLVMTALPVASVTSLTPRRFRLLRSILFPFSRLEYGSAMKHVHELDGRVRELARRPGVVLVEPRREWYGLDPIHIRRGAWPAAWREILSGWHAAGPLPAPAPRSLRRWVRLRTLAAERRWLFGRERFTPQPAGRLPDGTTLSFF